MSRNFNKSLRLFGVNAAGLASKLCSFKKLISDLQPSLFFVEETKFQPPGKLKLDKYTIFEWNRKSSGGHDQAGGGLALGCLSELQPVWVRDGGEEVEALSINIFLKKITIRCVVAYGCQESGLNEKKIKFLWG